MLHFWCEDDSEVKKDKEAFIRVEAMPIEASDSSGDVGVSWFFLVRLSKIKDITTPLRWCERYHVIKGKSGVVHKNISV